jgi:hypothetical protein
MGKSEKLNGLLSDGIAAAEGATAIEVSLLELTPTIADELLRANSRNRNARSPEIRAYAQMMRRGEWEPGVAVIAIDSRNQLINGQHTCQAVLRADAPVIVTLQRGMDRRTQDVMDTQRKRSLGDQLAIDGFSNATIVAAIARVAYVWRTSKIKPAMNATGSVVNGVDRKQLLAFCRANEDELCGLAAEAKRLSVESHRIMGPAAIGRLAMMFRDSAPSHGDEWIEQAFGRVEASAQPIAAYRNKLIELKGTRNEWTPQLKVDFAIKSFNAFAAKQQLTRFSVKANEQISINVPSGVE